MSNSFYVIHSTYGSLLYLSDIEPPNSYNAEGHHVFQSTIPLIDLQRNYEWSVQFQTWVARNPNILSKLQFLKKFTSQEYAQIKATTATNSEVDYYWQMFMVSSEIDKTDPDTIAGVNLLEQLGIIAVGRAAEILNG